MARLEFSVRVPEVITTDTPSPIDGYESQVLLGLTDKGYSWGLTFRFTTSNSNMCADATVSFQGAAVSPIESGGAKNVIVQTDAGVPVPTGTVLIDTPLELRISVPDPGALPVNSASIFRSGSDISYYPGDEGSDQPGRGASHSTLSV